jgi:hypothetical protein
MSMSMGVSQSRGPARRNDSKHMSISTTSRQDMISNDDKGNYLNSDDGKEVKKRYSSI